MDETAVFNLGIYRLRNYDCKGLWRKLFFCCFSCVPFLNEVIKAFLSTIVNQ